MDLAEKVSCVDLFCGAGGLTHGFVQEGFKVDAGVDLDPLCQYPYEKNNNSKFILKDITELTGEDLDKVYRPSTVKILAGCAPCQPFSTYSYRYDVKSDNKWGLLLICI